MRGSKRTEAQDDELNAIRAAAGVLYVPRWLRGVGVLLALLLMAPAVLFLWQYGHAREVAKAAADLGVANLLIAGTVVMLVALAPWNSLQLRLKKVGFVEFERVVNTQAKEHVEAFAELRARIEELENRIQGLDGVSKIADHLSEVDLTPLLLRFLEQFRPRAFSPVKIRQWGARQPGYEVLEHYPQGAIRRVLQSLVASGRVTTRVSKMGSTLYRIADS